MTAPSTSDHSVLPAAISALIVILLMGWSSSALASSGEGPPRITPRAAEDARAWGEADPDGIDRLKFLSLSDRLYLSVGGDFRVRGSVTQSPRWDQDADTNNLLAQRLMAHAELGVGEHLRTFVQVRTGFSQLRENPGPVDEAPLDFHQAFLELRDLGLGPFTQTVRAGRMEVSEGLLLSLREGPTIRLSHDGVWSEIHGNSSQGRVMVVRPVQISGDFFGDRSSSEEIIWGGNWRRPVGSFDSGSIDLRASYLGRRDNQAAYHGASGEELRHSIGAGIRTDKDVGGFSWGLGLETTLQDGSLEDQSIRAYRFSAESSLSALELPAYPKLLLRFDRATGDEDDDSFGTFHPYYPRGSFYSEFSFFAPSNITALFPALELSPSNEIAIRFDGGRFWRTSTDEGIYAVSMAPLIGGPSDESHLGDLAGIHLLWKPSAYTTLQAAAVQFWPGDYPIDLGLDATIRYLTAWMTLQY